MPIATARAACVDAELALDEGRSADAAVAWETALTNYDASGMLISSHCVRRRLGQLRGDSGGAQLAAAAEEALLAAGAVNITATSRLFVL